MSFRRRGWLGVAALVAAVNVSQAQTVVLAEDVTPGSCSRVDITLALDGKMKVERDGKLEPVPLKARAAHSLLERVDAADAKGGVGTTLRHYLAAGSEAEVGTEKSRRELAADRRLIVARRSPDGTQHYSPDGPLFREELELVAEHFDTLCLPALLPGKAVNPGETWPVGPEAAQHACLFEGLIKNELVGKFVDTKNGVATFTITGKAEGLECGANAKLTVSAAGKFDLAMKRVTELVWEQTDDRDQGPASPATEVKAVVTLKRSPLADRPKELADDGKAKPPADGKVPDLLLSLRYSDPVGRYTFVYHRDWHVVGRTRGHLVLRLVEKGEFTAQATVTGWQKAAPGHHAAPADFKAVLGKLPGWEPEGGTMEESEVPTDPGRWLYRAAGRGKQDGLPVVQIFYLLAGPGGDQVAVTVVAQPEKAARLSPKDLILVNAIDLPLKK